MRFIPAWAGNTSLHGADSCLESVHPRVGGEHTTARQAAAGRCGSSPRGRGTHGSDCPADGSCRFIPAWAGNTRPKEALKTLPSVHPRVGGEHNRDHAVNGRILGSSPRGRGTRRRCAGQWRIHRFIPAWAGNTAQGLHRPLAWPVHPRVGGEHGISSADLPGVFGSSPRGRGTLVPAADGLGLSRFIPAWAGNTWAYLSGSRARSVHPRVGGEHQRRPNGNVDCVGSSPRGRGTLHAELSRHD